MSQGTTHFGFGAGDDFGVALLGARFGELAPEWMLRDISGFKLREITLATATAAEVEPAPPSLLSRLLPVGALAMCLGPPKRSAGYGVMPSQTIPNV